MILDDTLPGQNGREVLNSIRRNVALQDLMVVMLTIPAEPMGGLMQGYHFGADMYLTKPFNLRELTSFVRRLLEINTDESRL